MEMAKHMYTCYSQLINFYLFSIFNEQKCVNTFECTLLHWPAKQFLHILTTAKINKILNCVKVIPYFMTFDI